MQLESGTFNSHLLQAFCRLAPWMMLASRLCSCGAADGLRGSEAE